MQKITTAHSQSLFDVAATRRIEQTAAGTLPAHTLMQRAGLAVARLSLALAPNARCIWVACGPGNNGGDGFEAARHLHQWGKRVVVTWTGAGENALPPDAQAARKQALEAGVAVADEPPPEFDFCIDALLGIGGDLHPARSGTALMLRWLQVMATSTAPTLAVDLPSGLNADTGEASAIYLGAARARIHWVNQRFTLSLLTLKPGLFTFEGRDSAGEVWFDDLKVEISALQQPSAMRLGAAGVALPKRLYGLHALHKGNFGDVGVIGGQSSASSHMAGAVLLAARAALHAGAGRVFVALLGNTPSSGLTVDTHQPELMFCNPEALDLLTQVIVCGCGGGEAIKAVLPKVLAEAPRLVLDADALNAIAQDTQLQILLTARAARGFATVLTPHPLEAASLLQTTTALIQADRLKAAAQLAERYQAVVVLKGSGSVIAAPSEISRVNSSGNALLATAGTGDVLAGMMGAAIANGLGAFEAACSAVFKHGLVADNWEQFHPQEALTASKLAALI